MQSIEIRVDKADVQTRYAVRFLFTAIGYPFRIVENWQNPLVKIVCSNLAPSDEFDLWFESVRRRSGKKSVLRVQYHDRIPILFYKEEAPPKGFIDSKQLLFPLLDITFSLLSREEETNRSSFSPYDSRYEVFQSELYDLGLNQIPILNRYVIELSKYLGQLLESKNKNLKPIPRWKNGKTFAVALTHDVDRIQYCSTREAWNLFKFAFDRKLQPRKRMEALISSAVQFSRAIMTGSRYDPFWNFETWMSLESKYNFRSTFYVISLTERGNLRDPSYRLTDKIRFREKMIPFQETLRIMQQEGWEIGLHGSIHSSENEAVLKREREKLASAVGSEVNGIRQHYLMFSVPEIWSAQERSGFTYDSSIGSNRRLGYRAGVGLPFQPFDLSRQQPVKLLELPLVIQDGVLMEEEPVGLERAFERCLYFLEVAKEHEALLVVLWHPNTAYEKAYPGWLDIYRRLLEQLSKEDAFIGTAGEIADWWQSREKQLFLQE